MRASYAICLLCASTLGAAGPGLPGGYRISDQGPPGDPSFGAGSPAVAYNGAADEFLVVWRGDDALDGEPEIYCQRIDAATGAEIGADDLKISAMGEGLGGAWPTVVYNPAADEYLVVWSGIKDEEIGVGVYVQRLDAQGAEIGPNDQRINAVSCETPQPKVACSPAAGEYLVVWNGCGHVFGQRLDATAAQIGDDFRVDEGAANAGNATLAYNELADEYLVVFQDAFQLFVRRLDAAGAALSGEIAIANAELAASLGVAWSSADNEYLVAWQSGDETLAAGELEIFGQRLDALGAEIGADDFRISDMGADGDPNVDARSSSVAYDPANDEYLVLWHGDDGTPPLGEGEFEIFGQRLDAATGAEVGPNDFRISRMGPDGDPAFIPNGPKAAFGAGAGDFLVVWQSDDDTPPQVDGETEIFVRRLGCPWDCGDDDGVVSTADIAALLAQWGGPGTCDTDGGGVTASDLLALIAAWGPCR